MCSLDFLLTDFCGVCKPLTLFNHGGLPFLVQQCEQVVPTSLYFSREEIWARKTSELRKGALGMEVGGSKITSQGGENHMQDIFS